MQTIEIRSAKVTFDKEKPRPTELRFISPAIGRRNTSGSALREISLARQIRDRPTVTIFRRKDRNLRSFSIDKYRPLW